MDCDRARRRRPAHRRHHHQKSPVEECGALVEPLDQPFSLIRVINQALLMVPHRGRHARQRRDDGTGSPSSTSWGCSPPATASRPSSLATRGSSAPTYSPAWRARNASSRTSGSSPSSFRREREDPPRLLRLGRRRRNAPGRRGTTRFWPGYWPADPGDEEILAHALAEGASSSRSTRTSASSPSSASCRTQASCAWLGCRPCSRPRSLSGSSRRMGPSWLRERSSRPSLADFGCGLRVRRADTGSSVLSRHRSWSRRRAHAGVAPARGSRRRPPRGDRRAAHLRDLRCRRQLAGDRRSAELPGRARALRRQGLREVGRATAGATRPFAPCCETSGTSAGSHGTGASGSAAAPASSARAGPARAGPRPPEPPVRTVDADVASGEALALLLLRGVRHRDEVAESRGGARDAEGIGSQRSLRVPFDPLPGATSPECDAELSPSMALVAQPHAVVSHDHHCGESRGRTRVGLRPPAPARRDSKREYRHLHEGHADAS
jgi:hypothetical protein